MHVLITGGAGYLGTEMVALLAEHQSISKITIYDNLSHGRHGLFTGTPIVGAEMVFHRKELLDSRSLQMALKGVDVVVHLAAKVSTPFAAGDPHAFQQVNHWGTAELSYALEDSSVKKVIYASSASVYGVSDAPKTVQDKPSPNTSYAISKLHGESMLLRLKEQMQVVVVRCANIYGYSPSLRFDAVINRFVRQAFFEGRISVEGDGKQLRPFIHIHHAATVFQRLVTDFSDSGVYNLVDQNRSIMDIANHLKDLKSDLEMMFIEQDMPRVSLQVESSSDLTQLYPNPPSFEEQIAEFVSVFRFSVN
tara:strand:+ start:597 stop:1517 length:921 start_codon:yes stop_codon:yes gene_type:complete